MGYPAAAMRNYLARLGWSHGDDEFFTDDQAKEWFDLGGLGKSAARFDFKKLQNLSGQHIAVAQDAALLREINEFLLKNNQPTYDGVQSDGLLRAMYCLKDRAKTFGELLEKGHFILTSRPLDIDEKAAENLNSVSHGILETLTPQLQNVTWSRDELETLGNRVAESLGVNFGKLAGPLRAALAGRAVTPSVFDMMLVLGREETIARLTDAAEKCKD
jgi:glutamyl-tRNA synthetase